MKFSKIWILIALLIPINAFAANPFFPSWSLFEHQPNIRQGGRTNSVAVNPADASQMLAASDSGGLFESVDGGLRWSHVDKLPVMFTQSIAYLPNDVVLVSAKADFKTTNGGGVWRRDISGDWAQVTLTVPFPSAPLSAYEISAVDENVVVGTSEGVFVSTNSGLSWTWSDPFGGGDRRVFSVLLTSGASPRIIAGGPGGVRLGTIAPGPWVPSNSSIGGIWSIHAFGRSPLSTAQAFVTTGHLLYRTEDAGTNWIQIPSAPQGAGQCAGTPFIKAALGKGFLYLYYGNACDLHRLAARILVGSTADYSGAWQQLMVEHFPRDLALSQRDPVLLASNGGLHNTSDRGLNWSFVGGGSAGYNALQVTDLKGQFAPTFLDLYFGTQDNNVWSINSLRDEVGRHETEGYFIDVERKVTSVADSKITYVACNNGACKPTQSKLHLADPAPVNHSTMPATAPVFVRRGQYMQNMPHGLDITYDPDMALWQPFAVFLEAPVGLPKLAFAAAGDETWAYQSYKEGAQTKLMKIHHLHGVGEITRPLMRGFGSLGATRLMGNAQYPVYALDTWFLPHVMAADIGQEKVIETWNSGDTWTEVPGGLTGLVTHGGELRFRGNVPDFGASLPLVTAISFYPEIPTHVLVGTAEGGIYYTSNRGETWARINGSERASYVTSFYWANFNTVFVSTFGRGIWRLRNQPIVAQEAFDQLCGICDVVSNDGRDRPPFDKGALVFNGQLLAVRTDNRQLREIFVTPGSSVVFTGDPKDPQDDIVITESDGKNSSQYEQLPSSPKGWIVKGVVFTKDDTLTGTVFGDSEASFPAPESPKG